MMILSIVTYVACSYDVRTCIQRYSEEEVVEVFVDIGAVGMKMSVAVVHSKDVPYQLEEKT